MNYFSVSILSLLRRSSLIRRVGSNFTWSIISEAVSKGIFFVSNIYLARVLGVEGFGIFSLAQMTVLYVWLMVDLGTHMYGIKEIAKVKNRPQHIVRVLFSLRLSASLVIFVLFLAGVHLAGLDESKQSVFVIAGLFLITNAFFSDWVFKGLEKFSYIALGNLVAALSFFLPILILVKGKHDIPLAMLCWSLSYLIGAMVLWQILRNLISFRFTFEVKVQEWLFHLKQSVWFMFAGSLMMLYQYLPVFLIGVFFSAYDVGLFNAPYKIVFAIVSFGFYLPMAFYPVLSELYTHEKKLFLSSMMKLRKIMLLCGVPIGLLCFLLRTQIVHFFLGNQYMASSGIFGILIWLVPLYFLRHSYGIPLAAAGLQKYVAQAGGIALATILVIGIPAMLFKSTRGIALSILVAEIAAIFRLHQITERHLKIS